MRVADINCSHNSSYENENKDKAVAKVFNCVFRIVILNVSKRFKKKYIVRLRWENHSFLLNEYVLFYTFSSERWMADLGILGFYFVIVNCFCSGHLSQFLFFLSFLGWNDWTLSKILDIASYNTCHNFLDEVKCLRLQATHFLFLYLLKNISHYLIYQSLYVISLIKCFHRF